MTRSFKRLGAVGVLGIAASLALAGCTSGGSTTNTSSNTADSSATADATGNRPAEETGPVTIKFVWWGNDTRNQLTQQVLNLFMQKYPNIKVETETADFNSYWQKLGTEIAAGQEPDVIQMDATYIQQFAADGNLMDLDSIGIDLSKFTQSTIDAGRVNGKLYAATFGVNVPVVVANPSVFQQAGVAMPDDSTWTWDDYATLAKEIGAKGGSNYYGSTVLGNQDALLTLWVRQHGKAQYNNDGTLGYDASDVSPMFQYWLDLQNAGGTPPATVQVQDDQAAFNQTLFATNKAALSVMWSNQVVALDAATGQNINLLRFPSVTGKAADVNLWLKSSMYLSIGANTQHADAALKLVEFLENDVDAGKILGTERGIPANSDVLAAVEPTLGASDQKVIDFMNEVQPILGQPNGLPQPGGSQSQTLQFKYIESVLLGTQTPDQAAQGFVNDLKAQMAG